MTNLVEMYVDGSFINNQVKWAYLIIKENDLIHQDSGVIDNLIIKEGRQIGGEVFSVIEGIKYLKLNKLQAKCFYDFTGIFEWVKHGWVKESPWNTTKEYTKYYKKFVMANKQYIKEFVKVKGHSNNKWNDEVDKLVKTAQNITVVDFNSF